MGTVTARLSGTERFKLPNAPTMVMVFVPKEAALPAVSVSTLVFAVLGELNDALTPGGNPATERLTLPPRLFMCVTVMTVVAVPPRTMVRLP